MFLHNLFKFKWLGKNSVRRSWGGFLLAVGWVLSPLSWWNDWVVNLPIAWIISSMIFPVDQKRFGILFVMIYWMTNLLGLLMMYFGWKGMVDKKSISKRDLFYSIVFSIAYTVLIFIFVWMGILKPL